MQDQDEVKPKRKSKKKPKTVKLSEPVQWGEEEISEITLQPPKGKHLMTLPSNPSIKDIVKIASKLSGVSMSVFDELASEDLIKVVEATGELL